MKLRTALAAASAVLPALAMAQAAPGADRSWYLGLEYDVTRVSNALSSASGEQADTISTTTARGGVSARLGRQRLYASAAVNHQTYGDIADRNSDGYTLATGLEWATVGDLAGRLSFHSQRRQADFNVGGITPVSVSNLERSDDLNLHTRLGGDALLGLELDLGQRKVRFSAPEYASRQYDQNSVSLGVLYRASGALNITFGASGSKTRYEAAEPGQPEPDRNERQDVFVSASWVATGASTVSARVAHTTQEYDLGAAANTSGLTGSLAWNWRPSGRTSVVTSLSRDTGQESGFRRTSQSDVVTATDFAQLTTRLTLALQYELTAKVGLTAELASSDRDFVDRVSGVRGADRTTTTTIGARWNALRSVTLGCTVGREKRTASGSGSSDSANDRYGCLVSATLD